MTRLHECPWRWLLEGQNAQQPSQSWTFREYDWASRMPKNDWRIKGPRTGTPISWSLRTSGINTFASWISRITGHGENLLQRQSAMSSEGIGSRSPIQALMDELTSGTCTYSVQTTGDGRVTHLSMAHPTSIRLACRYCGILPLDCTYKTNQFRILLLSIVGRTGMNSTIYLAIEFVSREGEADYIWALK